MTWLDVTSVVLLVAAAVVEARRGFVPAVIDLGLAFVCLGLAQTLTVVIGGPLGSDAAAFLILFFVLMALTVVASTLIDRYTKWEIGPFDSAVAGIVGAVGGLVVAHALYHAMTLTGDGGVALVGRSALAPEIYELRTIHALGDVLARLGGGRRISDEVRDRNK